MHLLVLLLCPVAASLIRRSGRAGSLLQALQLARLTLPPRSSQSSAAQVCHTVDSCWSSPNCPAPHVDSVSLPLAKACGWTFLLLCCAVQACMRVRQAQSPGGLEPALPLASTPLTSHCGLTRSATAAPSMPQHTQHPTSATLTGGETQHSRRANGLLGV